MTTEEMMVLADREAPELMAKTAMNMQLLERMAPEFMDEVVEDFQSVITKVSEKSKTAGIGSAGKDIFIAGAKGVGATVVAGLGVAIASDLYNAARRGLTSGRNWKRMMEANPTLRDHNQQEVRRAFQMVQRNAPDVAADPMAAGSLVFNVVSTGDVPGVAHKQLVEQVQAQKAKADSRYDIFKGAPKPIGLGRD